MIKNILPKEFDCLEIELKTKFNKKQGCYNYEFYHRGNLIFQGDQYYPSRLNHDCGDILTVSSQLDLLRWLTLQPDDTDQEYFINYTKYQFNFINSIVADDIISICTEIEEN